MKSKENVKNNDINLQADTLIDLPPTERQADEIKGGSPKLFLYCATGQH